ncbi:MAG: hypothetical protein ACKVIK_08515, partial [Rhodospirillales bacterium]
IKAEIHSWSCGEPDCSPSLKMRGCFYLSSKFFLQKRLLALSVRAILQWTDTEPKRAFPAF